MPPCMPLSSISRGVRLGKKCFGALGKGLSRPFGSREPSCGLTHRTPVGAAGAALHLSLLDAQLLVDTGGGRTSRLGRAIAPAGEGEGRGGELL
eukprot:scaffold240740_cov24-Tisochrysis_lutea.AAC.1